MKSESEEALSSTLGIAAATLSITFAASTFFAFIIYYRFLHPLARFPGPFVATQTNLWKSYQIFRGRYEYVLQEAHKKHGRIVRIGPNDLSINDESAIKAVYQSGRSFQKSQFYDAFTALRPNMFGVRDESLHAARRKTVAFSFSSTSIAGMESFVHNYIAKLVSILDGFADSGKTIYLDRWISFCITDILGELAFSRSFEALKYGEDNMPTIPKHLTLSMLLGQTPSIIPFVNKIMRYIPLAQVQTLVQGRAKLRELAIKSVNDRIGRETDRMDLLGRLLAELNNSQDVPKNDFDLIDIQTEAFGFIIGGTHTTASSINFALWHLLHNPQALSKVLQEINDIKPPVDSIYTYSDTSRLKYFQAVLTESFRINPVLVMPLPRVIPENGRQIGGDFIPGGTTVGICNYVLHHNDSIFGPNLESFIPERWLDKDYASQKTHQLMHFGAGHRACIGRNLAVMEISKLLVTLLARYKITPAVGIDPEDLIPRTRSNGMSELADGLPVTLARRDT